MTIKRNYKDSIFRMLYLDEKQPERKVYRLSDSFSKKQENSELELTVTVLNINAGNNDEILGNCKTLREYMQYTDKVLELLSELGGVPDTLRNMIESKTDTEILSKWIKAAAKCNTIKEFEDSM